jgi:hypothetical protein
MRGTACLSIFIAQPVAQQKMAGSLYFLLNFFYLQMNQR